MTRRQYIPPLPHSLPSSAGQALLRFEDLDGPARTTKGSFFPASAFSTIVGDTPQPPQISQGGWHIFHDDPEDKIVLKSSDAVMFRASPHILARSSDPIFKDMFEAGQDDSGKPIELDCCAPAIALFLDIISTSQDINVPHDLGPVASIDLRELPRRFEAVRVLDCSLQAYRTSTYSLNEPYWQILSALT